MNLAITTTRARTWKAVKSHYILAIAGATLAISAVVGAASIGNIDFGGSDAVVSEPVSMAAASADQQYVTYYLVDSQAQRDLIFAGEAEGALEGYASGITDVSSSVVVFVGRTPEEVESAWVAIYEGMTSYADTGTVVRIVDLLR